MSILVNGSVHTIKVSEVRSVRRLMYRPKNTTYPAVSGSHPPCESLFLEVLDLAHPQSVLLLVVLLLGWHDSMRTSATTFRKARHAICKSRIPCSSSTYEYEASRTETCSPVEPVIIPQFINLDPLLFIRRIRHRLCHHQRL